MSLVDSPSDASPVEAPWQRRARAVLALANALAPHFPPGDRAELRRLEPDDFNRPAFWRLLAEHVPDDLRRGDAAEQRWAMLLHCMAVMAPLHHQPRQAPGRVLAEADWPEGRMEQLLRARGDQVWPTLRRLCRFLAARGIGLDWVDFAGFVLADDEEEAERHRHRIARAYYAALAHADKT